MSGETNLHSPVQIGAKINSRKVLQFSKKTRIVKNVKQVKPITHTKPGLIRLQAGVLPATAMEIRIQAAKVGCTLGQVIDMMVCALAKAWKMKPQGKRLPPLVGDKGEAARRP